MPFIGLNPAPSEGTPLRQPPAPAPVDYSGIPRADLSLLPTVLRQRGGRGWGEQSWWEIPFTALEMPWDYIVGTLHNIISPSTATPMARIGEMVLAGEGPELISRAAREIVNAVLGEAPEEEEYIDEEGNVIRRPANISSGRRMLNTAVNLGIALLDPVSALFSPIAPTRIGRALRVVPTGVSPKNWAKWVAETYKAERAGAYWTKVTGAGIITTKMRNAAKVITEAGEYLQRKTLAKTLFTKTEQILQKVLSHEPGAILPWGTRWGLLGFEPEVNFLMHSGLARFTGAAKLYDNAMYAALSRLPVHTLTEAAGTLFGGSISKLMPGELFANTVSRLASKAPAYLRVLAKTTGAKLTKMLDYSQGLAKYDEVAYREMQDTLTAFQHGAVELDDVYTIAQNYIARVEKAAGVEMPPLIKEILAINPGLATLSPQEQTKVLALITSWTQSAIDYSDPDILKKFINPEGLKPGEQPLAQINKVAIGVEKYRTPRIEPGRLLGARLKHGWVVDESELQKAGNLVSAISATKYMPNEIGIAKERLPYLMVDKAFDTLLRRTAAGRKVNEDMVKTVYNMLAGGENLKGYISETQEVIKTVMADLMVKASQDKVSFASVLDAMRLIKNSPLDKTVLAEKMLKSLHESPVFSKALADEVRNIYPGWSTKLAKRNPETGVEKTVTILAPPSYVQRVLEESRIMTKAQQEVSEAFGLNTKVALKNIPTAYLTESADTLAQIEANQQKIIAAFKKRGYGVVVAAQPNTYAPLDIPELAQVIKTPYPVELNNMHRRLGLEPIFQEDPLKSYSKSAHQGLRELMATDMTVILRNKGNLAQPIKELTEGQIEVFTAAGWQRVSLRSLAQKMLPGGIEEIMPIAKRGAEEAFLVAPPVAQWLNSLAPVTYTGFLKFIHKTFNPVFKGIALLSPAAHAKNIGGNIIISQTYGVGPVDIIRAGQEYKKYLAAAGGLEPVLEKAAAKLRAFAGISLTDEKKAMILKELEEDCVVAVKRSGEELLPEPVVLSVKQLIDEMRKRGIFGKMIADETTMEFARQPGFWNRLKTGYKEMIALNYGIMGATDDVFKIATAKKMLERGHSLEDALMTARTIFVDYAKLTPFERKYAKAFFPFYTWTRKMGEIWAERVATHLPQFAAPKKLYDTISAVGRNGWKIKPEELPDFLANTMGVTSVYDRQTGDVNVFYLGRWIPFADLIRFGDMLGAFGAMAASTLGYTKEFKPGKMGFPPLIAEMITPIVKWAYETMSGDSLMNGQPIYAYSGEAKEYWGVFGISAWLTSIFRSIRFVNDINKLMNKNDPLSARATNFLTSVYIPTIDTARQRRNHNARVQDEIRRLYAGLKRAKYAGEDWKITDIESRIAAYRLMKIMEYGEED